MKLSYQPPYLWDNILAFLDMRAIQGVEKVQDGCYYRTIYFQANHQIKQAYLKVSFNPDQHHLDIDISEGVAAYEPFILKRLGLMFDVNHNPHQSYNQLHSLNQVHPELPLLGLRVPGSFDFFEVGVRAILGQQISVKAASTLAGRLATTFGHPFETPIEGLTHSFPTTKHFIENPQKVISDLGAIGINQSKAKGIIGLAHYFSNYKEDDFLKQNPNQVFDELCQLPQIGPWTANYILMRTLKDEDRFLESDYGVMKALKMKQPKEILALSKQWQPYRGYATFNLWEALAKE